MSALNSSNALAAASLMARQPRTRAAGPCSASGGAAGDPEPDLVFHEGSVSRRKAYLMGTTSPQGAQPSLEKVSDQIGRWLDESDDHTVGALLDLFEQKSFALLFII